MAGARDGDRRAMQALWQEHRRWIAAVLLAHKSPGDQLDDLLQEVAMTLVRRIDTLRDNGNVRAWLRTVAVNAARASARSRRARPKTTALEGEFPDAAAGRVPVGAGIDEEARHMLALVLELPEGYREPLLLRAVRGLRARHIARIMDLSEATVETRIARARRMLRDLAAARSNGRRPPSEEEPSDHELSARHQ